MSFDNEIGEYLASEGIGTIASDLYIGEMPLDKEGISLLLSPSPQPSNSILYFRQSINFWARYADYDIAQSKLQSIMDLFHQKEHYSLDNYYIYQSYADSMIEDLDRDSERRHLFTLSMFFVYRTIINNS